MDYHSLTQQEDRPRKLTEKLDDQFCPISINNMKRCKLPYWLIQLAVILERRSPSRVLVPPRRRGPTTRDATTGFGRGKERERNGEDTY